MYVKKHKKMEIGKFCALSRPRHPPGLPLSTYLLLTNLSTILLYVELAKTLSPSRLLFLQYFEQTNNHRSLIDFGKLTLSLLTP